MPPRAYAITVLEALHHLDHDHADFAAGVCVGRYMFWLGSGISLNSVPGLSGVVQQVIDHLQGRMAPGDPDDRFRKALVEIVEDVAGLSDDEKGRFEVDAPVTAWPDRAAIVERLTQRYSLMLNVDVDGEDSDYLLWYGVDPSVVYGSGLTPDVEHLCLAILGLEGVAPVMASANWDGLLEAAMADLTEAPAQHLGVVVLQQDLRDDAAPVRLFKFHGCAVLAGTGGNEYRKALVGSQDQITAWPHDPDRQAVRTRMISVATELPTVMVGFSAQDSNIQDIFSAVRQEMSWPWPSHPPALVFAEDQLGQWQKNLLRVTYGPEQYAADREEIQRSALVRAFGKPLLTALVLEALTQKAHALIRATQGLADADADTLCGGVTALRDAVAATAGTGTMNFVVALVAAVGRVVSIFRRGLEPLTLSRYERLTMQAANQVATTPSIDTDGVRELCMSLSLLGRGAAAALWSLDVAATTAGTEAAVRVKLNGGDERAVFFTATERAAIELRLRGPLASGAADAIVIRCDDPEDTLPRSASRPPGRTGSVSNAEVTIRQLLRDTTDPDALQRAFCLQAGLTP